MTPDDYSCVKRTALVVIIGFALMCLFAWLLITASGDGYVFAAEIGEIPAEADPGEAAINRIEASVNKLIAERDASLAQLEKLQDENTNLSIGLFGFAGLWVFTLLLAAWAIRTRPTPIPSFDWQGWKWKQKIGALLVALCCASPAFADNHLHLSRAQGDELRAFQERRLQVDRMNQLEYELDQLQDRIWRLWESFKATEARA